MELSALVININLELIEASMRSKFVKIAAIFTITPQGKELPPTGFLQVSWENVSHIFQTPIETMKRKL